MYSIVKNVLNQGGYDLTAIIKKIDTLWLQGKLPMNSMTSLQKPQGIRLMHSTA